MYVSSVTHRHGEIQEGLLLLHQLRHAVLCRPTALHQQPQTVTLRRQVFTEGFFGQPLPDSQHRAAGRCGQGGRLYQRRWQWRRGQVALLRRRLQKGLQQRVFERRHTGQNASQPTVPYHVCIMYVCMPQYSQQPAAELEGVVV